LFSLHRIRGEKLTKYLDGKKVCSGCKLPLDDDMFYHNASMPDQMTNECKHCIAKRVKYGPQTLEANTRRKILKLCEDFNDAVIRPEFTIKGAVLSFGSLDKVPARIEIPLRKTIAYTSAENLLHYALKTVTNLKTLDGHIENIEGHPTIIITGIIDSDSLY
jgi:hypothetical protein